LKRLISFIILYSSFLLLCPSIKAQWEGAQVQRLTYNDVPDKTILEFNINDNDKFYLFYLEGIRDTATGFVYTGKLLFSSKEKETKWSEPEVIDSVVSGTVKVGYDIRKGIIHIVYRVFRSLDYDTMYYTNSQMSNWNLVKIDSLSNEQNAKYESLEMVFDTLGNVHLLWNVDFDSSGTSWYRVMYANNSTGQWIKQQVSPPIYLGGMGSGPSYFDVQKNGAVHIVYGDQAYCDLDCHGYYVRNDSLNGTNWFTDTLPKPPRPLHGYGPGSIKVDVNDRVHLLTGGCIVEYCGPEPGKGRSFYYSKQAEDSVWTEPEIVLDSTSSPVALLIDTASIPYLLEWDRFTFCWFFTDRTQGYWREPYRIIDTTGLCNQTNSYTISDIHFVLDSQGGGNLVFSGSLFPYMGQDDSLEIFYYGSPLSSVKDTFEDHSELIFELSQNYPNPFNSATVISYSLNSIQPTHTTLKLYNILGEEVRELVNIRQSKGNYRVSWDGKDNQGKEVASGIYFYQLHTYDFKETKRMILIK
jgi:hypothetical protein